MTKAGGLSRRAILAGAPAAISLVVVGCGSAPMREQSDARPNADSTARTALKGITVYRDPNCGCCEAWAQAAENAGFRTTVIDRTDMPSIKRRYGVPEELTSCHTSLVGGYVVEGHVPLADVRGLLDAKPKGIKGIGVPGMPLGSPGMEVPDGSVEEFIVLAFDAAGRVSRFKL